MQELVGARPDIATLAEAIARALPKNVSCGEVANDVEEAVRGLGIDDLDAGPTPFGYTEPAEAAWQVPEDVVQPFVEDMKRRIDLGLEAEALAICQGILLGLYALRDDTRDDVLAHAPDFPEAAAAGAIVSWHRARHRVQRRRRAGGRPDFPATFVEGNTPQWKRLVDGALGRRRQA